MIYNVFGGTLNLTQLQAVDATFGALWMLGENGANVTHAYIHNQTFGGLVAVFPIKDLYMMA